VYSMMLMGMGPLGSLVAGAAADRLGAPVTVAVAGGACIGAAILFWAWLPNFRPAARRLVAAQQALLEELPQDRR